jgi:succinyl-CoA synthetase beta subunit
MFGITSGYRAFKTKNRFLKKASFLGFSKKKKKKLLKFFNKLYQLFVRHNFLGTKSIF